MDQEIKAQSDKLTQQTEVLVGIIKPSLAGMGPEVQGAVLADLFAIFIAGHPKALRNEIRMLWLNTVGDLVDLYDKQNSPKKNSKKNQKKSRKK